MSGLLHSNRNVTTMPDKINANVIINMIFVCVLNRRQISRTGIFFARTFESTSTTSHQTTNPSPPQMIRNDDVSSTSGESAYVIRLSGPMISIPALQNAEIALNTEYQIPCATPNCGINANIYKTAPNISTITVPLITRFINTTMPCIVLNPKAS